MSEKQDGNNRNNEQTEAKRKIPLWLYRAFYIFIVFSSASASNQIDDIQAYQQLEVAADIDPDSPAHEDYYQSEPYQLLLKPLGLSFASETEWVHSTCKKEPLVKEIMFPDNHVFEADLHLGPDGRIICRHDNNDGDGIRLDEWMEMILYRKNELQFPTAVKFDVKDIRVFESLAPYIDQLLAVDIPVIVNTDSISGPIRDKPKIDLNRLASFVQEYEGKIIVSLGISSSETQISDKNWLIELKMGMDRFPNGGIVSIQLDVLIKYYEDIEKLMAVYPKYLFHIWSRGNPLKGGIISKRKIKWLIKHLNQWQMIYDFPGMEIYERRNVNLLPSPAN